MKVPALLGLALLAACSMGGNSANPVARSLGWFAFLDGDDVRRECAAGGPERYRFVYNGRWGEQVRIYELRRPAPRLDAELTVRIVFPETLTTISSDDILAPWRGRTAGALVSEDDLAALDRALAESGFDAPAPSGLALHSDGTYWVAMACRAGAFHWNAYAFPSKRFAMASFPQELLKSDRTGVAVLAPRPGGVDRYEYSSRAKPRGPVAFDLEVGDNGLKLVRPLL